MRRSTDQDRPRRWRVALRDPSGRNRRLGLDGETRREHCRKPLPDTLCRRPPRGSLARREPRNGSAARREPCSARSFVSGEAAVESRVRICARPGATRPTQLTLRADGRLSGKPGPVTNQVWARPILRLQPARAFGLRGQVPPPRVRRAWPSNGCERSSRPCVVTSRRGWSRWMARTTTSTCWWNTRRGSPSLASR